MLVLGKLTSWLMGSALTPALIIGVLVLGGKYLDSRRAALVKQGVQQCETKWEVEIAKQHRDVAIADARALQAQYNAVDVLNMELKSNAHDIQKQFDAARAALAGVDGKCLSDSVRELARGIQGGAGSNSSPPAKDRVKDRKP